MSFWANRSKKKFDKRLESQEDMAIDETRDKVEKFVSIRNVFKKAAPQIILGLVVAIVEYMVIGPLYTIASVLVFTPVIYFYSKSLRHFQGKILLEIYTSKGITYLYKYLIPDELWKMMKFEVPPLPGFIRLNDEDVYIATRTWKIDGTNTIYKVKLAWLHRNISDWIQNQEVFERVISFAENLQRLNNELEKLYVIQAKEESKQDKKGFIRAISSVYRDDPSEMNKKISETKESISTLEKQNEDLLIYPEVEEEVGAHE
jgi:hypothetical protein